MHLWLLTKSYLALRTLHPDKTIIVREADARSWFYQIPIAHALSRYFCLPLGGTIHALLVLSQGWTPSSSIAHTIAFATFFATLGTHISQRPLSIHPWIDNFHTISLLEDADRTAALFQQLEQEHSIALKPWAHSSSILNIDLHLIGEGSFRVTPEWCAKMTPVISKRIDRQHVSLRATWRALGCVLYSGHTHL
jgi:hypothetical protein